MNRWCEVAVEEIRNHYATTASQMRCPVHQKNAKIEVEADDFNNLSVEVFTCCDQFRDRVRQALRKAPLSY